MTTIKAKHGTLTTWYRDGEEVARVQQGHAHPGMTIFHSIIDGIWEEHRSYGDAVRYVEDKLATTYLVELYSTTRYAQDVYVDESYTDFDAAFKRFIELRGTFDADHWLPGVALTLIKTTNGERTELLAEELEA